MTFDVEIDGREAKLTLDDQELRYERVNSESVNTRYTIVPTSDGRFSVLIGTRSFDVTLTSDGSVFVDGRQYQVTVSDPRSLRGRKSGAEAGGRRNVIAPMPGRVIRVLVEIGQGVEAGQGLIVVEAMKMQNEIKAPAKGNVTRLDASEGIAVVAGEVLLVLE